MVGTHALHSLSDDELLRRLAELVQQSRRVEAELVAHIAEVDKRRLFAREASPSMFVYCTEVLHLSEAEAYLRIAVARAAREHPILLTMLGDGRLHLSGIASLAPYLTRGNRDALLTRATHRSKRQIQELITEIAPRPDVLSAMRKLPERRSLPTPALSVVPDRAAAPDRELCPDAVGPLPAPPRRPAAVALAPTAAALAPPTVALCPSTAASGPPAVVQPLSPGRYKIQFTASVELHDKLERLRALLRGRVPDGDLATIIDQAVTEKLEGLEARRFAKTRTPRRGLSDTDTSPASRHIPAAVRRVVSERDGNRCGYVDDQGRRCTERYRLEYHHRHPFALGGDRSPKNIRLLCRAHNAYLAEHDYGRSAMARYSRSTSAGNPRPAKTRGP